MILRIVKNVLPLVVFAGSSLAQIPRPPGVPAVPQPTSESTSLGSIRGRVVLPGGTFIAQSAKVTVQSLRGTQTITYTDNQGQFEIRSLSPGEYTLEAEADKLRFDASIEHVQVYKGMPSTVTITLKEKSASDGSRPAKGVVSVGEFDKSIPAKARKEFDRASKASKEGKAVEAIDHLRKAIAIYPDFVMAHNDLGAQLLEQGNLEEAALELRRASELDDKAFNPYLNLGIVLVRQQKFFEAIDILRKALSLDSSSPAARLYLGLALMGQNDLESAEKELKTAYNLGSTPYALALFHLGEVYMNRGDRVRALQALEGYLREAPNATYAAQARKLISMLR
ncbi:MAG TPA: tetratricopeptide repeat protein [Pyrinomonadaceae bacterium]|nr:tetratricopeptide repeat protein [Pyrinomonadaceae bacterium]